LIVLFVIMGAPAMDAGRTQARAQDMKIEAAISTEGGVGFFPGLARERKIDVKALGVAGLARLAKLVESSDFFKHSDPAGPPKGADMRTHTITITIDGRSKTLRIPEPITNAGLAALVDFLREHAK
jgi:hypothetical protein